MSWSIGLSCAGMILALQGAWFASSMPLFKLIAQAGSFGGGDAKISEALEMKCRTNTYKANFLLVTGTFLQVLGALYASKL
jgi:hypothetical protein